MSTDYGEGWKYPSEADAREAFAERYGEDALAGATYLDIQFFGKHDRRIGEAVPPAPPAASRPRVTVAVKSASAKAPEPPASPPVLRDPTGPRDEEASAPEPGGATWCRVHRMYHNPPVDHAAPGAVEPPVVVPDEIFPALDDDTASMHNTSGPSAARGPASEQPIQEATMHSSDPGAAPAPSGRDSALAPAPAPAPAALVPSAPPPPSRALTIAGTPAPVAVVQSAGPLSLDELDQHVDLVKALMKKHLREGEHFGVIPGTEKKSLLKPGAEKLGLLFRLVPRYAITRNDLAGGHREYEVACDLFSLAGVHHGQGVGNCSTMETKYRYRHAARACPECGASAVIRGKKEYGGGWLCWKKKNGCGKQWPDDSDVAKAFAAHDDKVENPDLADTYNTVLKMAKKRAFVDATIQACAASDIFTQDVADPEEEPDVTPARPPVDAPKPAARPTTAAGDKPPSRDPAANGNGTWKGAGPAPAGGSAPRPASNTEPATAKQLGYISSLAEERGTTVDALMFDRSWVDGHGQPVTMTRQMASTLIGELLKMPKKTGARS